MQSAILLPAIAGAAVLILAAVALALLVRQRRRRATADNASWSVAADDTGQELADPTVARHADEAAVDHQ